MRVNRLADVHGVRTHLNGQRHSANHVTRVGADHAAAQYLPVAVSFRAVVKQKLGHAFVAAVERSGCQFFVALQFTGNHFAATCASCTVS